MLAPLAPQARESEFRPKSVLPQIWAFLQPVYTGGMNSPENRPDSRLSPAGWVAIAVLLLLLGWAIWYAVGAWQAMSGVHLSMLGWVFLSLGALVTFLVGAGLMALVFYSSRHDLDR
jgi:hypothetical protein